jgi:hypothetical protein
VKIPNPWPHQAHIRFNVNNGECTGSCGGGPEIEVPDTAVEVLIEPCARGRYDSETLAPGRMWSKEFGMLDVADHMKKLEIEKEAEALKVRQEADRLRRQDEVKDPVGIEIQMPLAIEKEEPKKKIDVVRAASGLAKVTKALKPKK